MNILLVDDSPVARMLIQSVIAEHNSSNEFNFFNAENGQYALEILNNHKIDIMFLDLNMPVMDGEGLIQFIREKKAHSHIKIVIASAEDSKEKVLQMLEYKVNGYLVKPFEKKSISKIFNTLYSVKRSH